MLPKPFDRRPNGLTTVAYSVLLVIRKFRLHAPARDQENRVIPEAPFSSRCKGYGSLLHALEAAGFAGWPSEGYDGPVSCSALVRRHGFKVTKQQGCSSRVVQPLSAVAGRVHPRLTSERINFDTGIIGEREAVAGFRERFSLERGVLGVRHAGLFDLQRKPELCGSHCFEPARRQQSLELAHFARVIRGEEDASLAWHVS